MHTDCLGRLRRRVSVGLFGAAIGLLAGASPVAAAADATEPISSPASVRAETSAHEGTIRALHFSRDASRLASLGEDHVVRVWDVADLSEVASFQDPLEGRADCVALSADGGRLLVAGEGRTIVCFNVDDDTKAFASRDAAGGIRALTWRPDGSQFVTVGSDDVVRIWNGTTGKLLREAKAPHPPTALLFSNTDDWFQIAMPPHGLGYLYAGDDDEIAWKLSRQEAGADLPIVAIACSASDSVQAFIAGETLFKWRKPDHRITKIEIGPTSSAQLAITEDERSLVIFGGDGGLQALAALDSKRLLYHRGTAEPAAVSAIAPGGLAAASGYADGRLCLWQLAAPPRYCGYDRYDFSKEVTSLLADEKYAELDALAETLRRDQPRLPLGEPKLWAFYEALVAIPADEITDALWEERLARLEKWREVGDDSPTARIALGLAKLRYGWFARGAGFANTVGEEQWALFAERVSEASVLFQEAAADVENDPAVYGYMIDAAKGSGDWFIDDVRALCDKATEIDAEYYPACIAMAEYLLPRWHGEQGDLERFAEETAARLGGDRGEEQYFRLASHIWYYETVALFANTAFEYPRVKAGGKAFLARHPEAYQSELTGHLNHLCMFACMQSDHAFARELFEDIGPHWAPAVFREKSVFDQLSARADNNGRLDDAAPIAEAGATSRTLDLGRNTSAAAFSPDSSKLAVGTGEGRVVVLDTSNGEEVANVVLGTEADFGNLEFSPDGVHVAGSMEDSASGETLMFVWDWQSGETTTLAQVGYRSAGPTYSADGRSLAGIVDGRLTVWDAEMPSKPTAVGELIAGTVVLSFVGQTRQVAVRQRNDILILDADTGERVSKWSMPDGVSTDYVKFSADRTLLMATCSREQPVRLFDLASGELLATLERASPGAASLDVTPDGRYVAVAYGSELVLWTREAPELVRTEELGLVCFNICISPDGRWMACGGRGGVQLLDLPRWMEPSDQAEEDPNAETASPRNTGKD